MTENYGLPHNPAHDTRDYGIRHDPARAARTKRWLDAIPERYRTSGNSDERTARP